MERRRLQCNSCHNIEGRLWVLYYIILSFYNVLNRGKLEKRNATPIVLLQAPKD